MFESPSGIWSSRRPFLQCCGIALFPVSRRLVLGERCQMVPVGKRRLCTCRVSHSTKLTARMLPRKRYLLRKCSRYLASTSLLRVCLSVADGWVLFVLGQQHNTKMSKVIQYLPNPLSPGCCCLVQLLFDQNGKAAAELKNQLIKVKLPTQQIYCSRFHTLIDVKFACHGSTHGRRRTPTYNLKKAVANEPIFRIGFRWRYTVNALIREEIGKIHPSVAVYGAIVTKSSIFLC